MKHLKSASFLLLGLVSLTAACQQKPPEAPKASAMTEDQKAIYAYGAAIGQQMAEQNKQLRLSAEELEVFRNAFGDTVSGKEPAVKIEEYETKFRELAQARIAAGAADARKTGEEFLASAASQQGAVKTDSGLVFRTITPGKGGAHPQATDKVKVHYQGTLPDGTVFDSSLQRGQPAEFTLNQVIPCWTEGVQRMQVGEKAQLVCPATLAYGDRNTGGPIPPGSTLNFEVELLEINPKQ
ncbi:FKBP-type 22 kDa peptidyl-prolyl cis-trans isomerase [Gammaproteobacteria bacterium]|nr:FKBP-type peptidyl-prolyl cis-trans isomerase [Gammaproteobacteria bacterium]QOJ32812.1 MAG: FKBP-type peptidyl-prolyl cis-trans isomerase [Gammaproteobacteria bacterium]CAG0944294.1 FKBP-type 22 kDa peptidyl-prolyl cis-trans isomerase [Gammaproteobacteria bacterium]